MPSRDLRPRPRSRLVGMAPRMPANTRWLTLALLRFGLPFVHVFQASCMYKNVFFLGIVVWRREAQNRKCTCLLWAPCDEKCSTIWKNGTKHQHTTPTRDTNSMHHSHICLKYPSFYNKLRARWSFPQRNFSPSRRWRLKEKISEPVFSSSTHMADRIVPLKDTARKTRHSPQTRTTPTFPKWASPDHQVGHGPIHASP